MHVLFGTLLLLISGTALAAPPSLTYQGRIIKADGKPLENSSVSFQFEITTPNGGCVLYREQVNGINMANSNGVFDIKIGQSHSYPASAGFSILDSFNNSSAMVCDGGASYNPILSDGRLLRVQFHDGTSWKLISPDNIIRSVPYAAYSESSSKLGGHLPTEYLLKNEINGGADCDGGSFLTWNATTDTFSCAAAPGGGGGGSGTVTELFSGNSYLTVTNATTTPTLTLNVGTTANTVAAGNDSRFTNARIPTGSAGGDLGGSYPNPSVSKIQGVGIDFSVAPNSGEVLTFNGTSWVSQSLPATSSGTVTGITAGTGLTGGTINTSGTIGLGTALSGLNAVATNGYIQRTGAGTYSTTSGNIAASNNTLVLRDGSGVSSFYGVGISGATSGLVTLQAPLISGTYSLTLPDAQGAANQVMANDGNGILSWVNVPSAPGSACGAGNVLTYNGTAFTCVPDQVGSAGGGIATLNSQTGSSQSFGNGSSGNSPNWSSASDVHTLNIPMAATVGVTAGLISKTQYDAFNAKQTALGFTPLNPANNLSDLASASAARSNLGLGTAALKNAPATGNASTTEVVMGDDTRLTNSRAPSGSAGGDLGGTYPNPDVNRLKGVGLSITSLTSGNFLKYNGTHWINSVIDPSDVTGLVTALGSKIDQSQISGTCAANSTLVFSSVSGTWTCTSIGIADSQVTFASKSAKTFLAAPTGGAGAPTFRTIASTDLPAAITDAAWTADGSGNVYRPTGSVGIGTISPQSPLHIKGSQGATSTLIVERNSNSADRMDLAFKPNGAESAASPSWMMGVHQNEANFRIASWDGTTFSRRLTVDTTGNVGIGTTTPTGKIHTEINETGYGFVLTDSAAPAGTLRLQDGTSGAGLFQPSLFGRPVGNTRSTAFYSEIATGEDSGTTAVMSFMSRIETPGPVVTRPLFDFRNYTTPVMTIAANGNTGIGTATPSTKLEVNGTVKATAFEGPLTATVNSSGSGSNTAPSYTFSGDPDTGFYNASSNNSISVTTGGTNIFNFSSTGLASPTTGGALISTGVGSAAAPTFSFAGDPDTGWYRPAADTLAASTAGTERLRIDATGRIGIGTTPTSRLHILNDGGTSGNDDISLVSYNSNDEPALLFSHGNGTLASPTALLSGDVVGLIRMQGYNGSAFVHSGGLLISAENDWTTTASTQNSMLALYTLGAGANTEKMRITSGGKVGIGTTNPGVKLEVNDTSATGNVNLAYLLAPNQTDGSYSTIKFGKSVATGGAGILGVNPNIASPNDAFMWFSVQGDNGSTGTGLIVKKGGNVGIGNTSPTAPLQIGTGVYLGEGGTSGSSATGSDIRFTGAGLISADDSLTLSFDGNNDSTNAVFTINKDSDKSAGLVELFRINESGYVGIGNSAPAYALDVAGYGNFSSGIGVGAGLPSSSIAINSSYTVHANATRQGINNVLTIDDTTALSANRSAYGAYNDVLSNMTYARVGAAPYTEAIYGAYNRARLGTTGFATTMYGSYNYSNSSNTDVSANDTIATSVGAYNYSYNTGVSPITNSYGSYNFARQNGASTITNAYGVYSQVTNTSGTMTNGTAFRGDLAGTIGTAWGIYLTGEDKNYFSGNVGLGTTSPTQKLHVIGNIFVDSTYDCTMGNASGSVSCSSDERLKENIKPIPDVLKKVLNVRGVEFDWNEKSNAHGRHDIGVIAQEVEKVFPSVVHESKETGMKMVDYGSLVAPLLGAVKELYNLWFNDSQEVHRQLASLNEENRKFATDNEILKKSNARLEMDNQKKSAELEDIKARLEKIESLIEKTK